MSKKTSKKKSRKKRDTELDAMTTVLNIWREGNENGELKLDAFYLLNKWLGLEKCREVTDNVNKLKWAIGHKANTTKQQTEAIDKMHGMLTHLRYSDDIELKHAGDFAHIRHVHGRLCGADNLRADIYPDRRPAGFRSHLVFHHLYSQHAGGLPHPAFRLGPHSDERGRPARNPHQRHLAFDSPLCGHPVDRPDPGNAISTARFMAPGKNAVTESIHRF